MPKKDNKKWGKTCMANRGWICWLCVTRSWPCIFSAYIPCPRSRTARSRSITDSASHKAHARPWRSRGDKIEEGSFFHCQCRKQRPRHFPIRAQTAGTVAAKSQGKLSQLPDRREGSHGHRDPLDALGCLCRIDSHGGGVVRISELSWSRIENREEVVSSGDTVQSLQSNYWLESAL